MREEDAVRRLRNSMAAAPIMIEFKAWLDDLAPKLLPSSLLAKAVHYGLGQWNKLSVFLTDPIVPLDNNKCENAIRPFVMTDSFCTSSSSIWKH
jgi:hypothetical protein